MERKEERAKIFLPFSNDNESEHENERRMNDTRTMLHAMVQSMGYHLMSNDDYKSLQGEIQKRGGERVTENR